MITPRRTRLLRVADLHAFRRALVAWQLDGPLGLELGAGYDWMRAVSSLDSSTFGDRPTTGFWRLDLGVRWVP